MKTEKNTLLFVCWAIAALGVILFACFAMWWGLNISIHPQDVGNILATLVLIAGFIERAVEVIITPWRDTETKRLRAAHVAARAIQGATQQQTSAREDLNKYKGKTRWYAFSLAFMFGLVAAMVGVRALWPFLSADAQAMAAFKNATLGQKNTFIIFDVVLSAAMMAGGANGLHAVINMITSSSEATAEKAKNSAAA